MSLKQKHHLLTILVVLVVSAGAFLTWRASAQTEIDPGYDQFNTPDDSQTMEMVPVLPPGFFTNHEQIGSNELDQVTMTFKGGPPVPNFGADTVVQREDLVFPGTDNNTTRIVLSMSLVGGGTNPQVTAHFNSGTPSVTYDVSVRESQIQPSMGMMQFLTDTFNILDWPIHREYTFTPTDPAQPSRVADSTTEKIPGTDTFVFGSINFGGGNGTWSGGGHIIHIQPHLHGPPAHNHFVLPTPTPSPSPSLIPTMTVKPIGG